MSKFPTVIRGRLSSLLVAIVVSLFGTPRIIAVQVDLTPGPTASGQIGHALFSATAQQPAGTGFIQPFLRVQDKGNVGFEQGYNTDGGFVFDDKHPHNFQHSLPLSSLAQINIGGINYFQFMLDANEPGGTNSHTFTLTQLQFYTSNDPAQTITTFNPGGTLPLGALAYNLNPGGGTTNSVLTTATGSGKFDAIVDVPVSDFNLSNQFVYLYFAGNGHGGFEEWTAATAAIPEPSATALLILGGLTGFASVVRRKTARSVS